MSTPTISGVIGLIIISVAIWIKNEKRQDILFIIGGLFLLLYSISIKNVIFSVLQTVFILSAFIEVVRMKKP